MRQNDFTVTAAGRRLAVRRLEPEGPAAEATLVFLHEGLGSIAQWRDFPEALAERCGLPALIYERWGFGGSEPLTLPRPLDYLEEEAETALPDVLAACEVEAPILVGHSDGGSIALLYAAAFPNRPLAAITMAAHVFVEEVTLAGIREAVRLWQTTDLKERLARYHREKADNVFHGWADTWLSPPFAAWNIEERLPRIRCPLLVMQGADDEYGTPAQVDSIVENSGGPAQALLLPECGHAPHLQAKAQSLEAITTFLKGLGLVSGSR